MGLLVGTSLTLVRTAPMGDPIEIKVRGYHLTLRKSEAEHVLVSPVA
jgi:ferrous iron transport protein A